MSTTPHTPETWRFWPTHWTGGSSSVQYDGRNTVWIQSDEHGEICRMACPPSGPNEHTYKLAQQIVDSANACAGMADPAAEIQAMRDMKMGLARLTTEQTRSKVCEANALQEHITEIQKILPDDTTIQDGITRLQRENAAMQDAIKEAHDAFQQIYLGDIFDDAMRDISKVAITKLKPFIKP